MDEGQRTQASIKEEASESGKGRIPPPEKKGSMGGNTLITHADHKKDPPSGNQGRLQWSSGQVRGAQSHRMRRHRV